MRIELILVFIESEQKDRTAPRIEVVTPQYAPPYAAARGVKAESRKCAPK